MWYSSRNLPARAISPAAAAPTYRVHEEDPVVAAKPLFSSRVLRSRRVGSGPPCARRRSSAHRHFSQEREVRLTWSRSDQYGRPLARVVLDGQDVNAEQVRRGYA
ncbi:thermonuclease family protein [Piscinibacter koreensis]|uniref:thermonuclease family protein n=1 Tax=Piscinibacter koreensis TaxID=2742824 RepID=UPI003CC91776